MLEIRRLDPSDDETFSAWMRLYREAWQAFDPSAEVDSSSALRALLQPGPQATSGLEGYVAYDGGLPVGAAGLSRRLADNRDRGAVHVHVPPAYAGRGVATAMLAYAEERAKELGIRHLSGQPREENPAAMALARRAGFRLRQTEVERRLPLPVDPDVFERMDAETRPHRGRYIVRTIVGPLPEELLPSWAELKNRMTLDAPSGGEQLEAGGRTPANLRAQDRQLIADGCERISGVAQDEDGTVVGAAELVVQPGVPGIAQWGTIVAPSARGHRLGLAMKVAAARVAQERHPERRYIVTDNAETNAHVVAINDALGFRVYARYATMTKEL